MVSKTTKFVNGVQYKLVFRKFIVRNGKRIYPKKAKCFAFWVPVV